jgi:hypothetical protein
MIPTGFVKLRLEETMIKVVIDAEMRAKLNRLEESLDLYDQNGRLLGHFTPANRGLDPLPPDPGLDSLPVLSGPDPFSDAEIAEASKDTRPGRPLADILADLRRL